MGKIFLSILFLTFFSCSPRVDREDYEVTKLTDAQFIYKDIQLPVEKIGNIKETSKKLIDELLTEANQLGLEHSGESFIRLDPKRSYILDVGLLVKADPKKIAPDKLRFRPAGKYLIIKYKIPNGYEGRLFEDFPATIKEARVTPVNLITYIFGKSGSTHEEVHLHLQVE